MNNWKDVPNLFCNGKFMVKSDSINFMSNSADYIGGIEDDCFYVLGGGVVMIDDCTLIARKIEDMTDKEWENMKSVKFNKNQIERRKKWFKIQVLTADDMMYLLSIGVYPFNQSHFKTGEVIDINTLIKNK